MHPYLLYVFPSDPSCPPAAAVSREALPLAPTHRHRPVSAVHCQPAGHPRS